MICNQKQIITRLINGSQGFARCSQIWLATKIGGATTIKKLWVKWTLGSWSLVRISIVLVPLNLASNYPSFIKKRTRSGQSCNNYGQCLLDHFILGTLCQLYFSCFKMPLYICVIKLPENYHGTASELVLSLLDFSKIINWRYLQILTPSLLLFF